MQIVYSGPHPEVVVDDFNPEQVITAGQPVEVPDDLAARLLEQNTWTPAEKETAAQKRAREKAEADAAQATAEQAQAEADAAKAAEEVAAAAATDTTTKANS